MTISKMTKAPEQRLRAEWLATILPRVIVTDNNGQEFQFTYREFFDYLRSEALAKGAPDRNGGAHAR